MNNQGAGSIPRREPFNTRSTTLGVLKQDRDIIDIARECHLMTRRDEDSLKIALLQATITLKAELAQMLTDDMKKPKPGQVYKLLKAFIEKAAESKVHYVDLTSGILSQLAVNEVTNYERDNTKPTSAGGFGVVRCVKLACGTLLAEKKVKDFLPSEHDEVALLQSLGHPHTISLYAAFVQDTVEGVALLTSPWCNCDLDTFLRKNPTPFIKNINKLFEERKPFLINTSTSLLAGLAYLHQNRIVHNDLKPSNILLYQEEGTNDPPIIKITDFGASARLHIHSSSNSTDNRTGSMFYKPPERIAESHSKYSAKGNIWSVSLIIIEILLKVDSIKRSWERIQNNETGFGVYGPGVTIKTQEALDKAVRWVMEPLVSQPISSFQAPLLQALSLAPGRRGAVSTMWKTFSDIAENARMGVHCTAPSNTSATASPPPLPKKNTTPEDIGPNPFAPEYVDD